MYCLDANVWAYLFDSELDEHERVRDPVAEILADEPVLTTMGLQMEAVHYLTNQLTDSESYVDRFLRLDDRLDWLTLTDPVE